MKRPLLLFASVLSFSSFASFSAEPDFPLTEDSKPHDGIAKGTLIKDTHTAGENSVFPGTVREYQIYLPAGIDQSKPAPFMVFQDGVIYQAPIVFDNLIAKKEIPPLIGIFVKPGVVPAANDNALPRFNRSYEYDSFTDTYARFLIDELLPAIEKKHGIRFSTDPDDTAIAGNSSGGICAFMAAWHRPDRFRRVFTGVGTYVGIHGADQLPVLVRKFEPKPLRVFLQSGSGDNNLYCGDWWMANQMMERSLTWNGYDVNHAWGEGGHNAKHATAIFPDALRWLWRDWLTNKQIKANPRGESKWKGYEVVGDGEWKLIFDQRNPAMPKLPNDKLVWQADLSLGTRPLASTKAGDVWVSGMLGHIAIFSAQDEKPEFIEIIGKQFRGMAASASGMIVLSSDLPAQLLFEPRQRAGLTVFENRATNYSTHGSKTHSKIAIATAGRCYVADSAAVESCDIRTGDIIDSIPIYMPGGLTLSPDQTLLFLTELNSNHVACWHIDSQGKLTQVQHFHELQSNENGRVDARGLCVDTNGWLYVATSLGIQVCDQAGRVNFIIPTPKQPYDVCFGGKDLSELFIACGDTIYKRKTTAHGYISGQMAPIKPPPPKL